MPPWFVSVCCVVLCLVFLAAPVESACVVRQLMNFDIYNFTDYQANGFMLRLEGIGCHKIQSFWEGYYPGYYDSVKCWYEGGQTVIQWWFPLTDPGIWMGFGMQLWPTEISPVPTLATWLFDDTPVPWGEFCFVWVRRDGTIDCPISPVLPWNETDPWYLGVWVERKATAWFLDIPLENL
jgi:hypothetical protein